MDTTLAVSKSIEYRGFHLRRGAGEASSPKHFDKEMMLNCE